MQPLPLQDGALLLFSGLEVKSMTASELDKAAMDLVHPRDVCRSCPLPLPDPSQMPFSEMVNGVCAESRITCMVGREPSLSNVERMTLNLTVAQELFLSQSPE